MQSESGTFSGSGAQPAKAAIRQPSYADCCIPLDSGSLHDLFSPVNQMCSITDLLLKKYRGTLDSDAEVLFGFIQASANRVQNLMGGLRTYMQMVGSGLSLHQCDGNSLLAEALECMRSPLELSGASLTYDRLPELYCDPAQVSYIFAILIDNAIKFRGECKPEIRVSAKPEGDHVVCSFRDNGIGIDPRYHESIFGVFKRIHNDAYPGSGIGLAIAKKIAEGHRGRIWVESSLGRGSTFSLALPKAQE